VEDGVGVACVEHLGIGAVVSLVPAKVYEEQPLEEHCKDPCWLAARAERHNRVLLQILEHTAVAPCRFGTLFRDFATVKEIIACNRRLLSKTLRRLQDRVEWSVKAYVTRPSRPSGDKHHGRTSSRRSGSERAQGAAYLLGLARARTAQREVDVRLRNHAKRIIGALSRLSEDVVLLPVRDTESDKGMIFLDLACLVKRGNMPAFASRLQKLGAGEKKNDIALSWSGPWPAYSFAGSSFHPAGRQV
jgi:hypothetical protein